jgi:hypothetical protein
MKVTTILLLGRNKEKVPKNLSVANTGRGEWIYTSGLFFPK